VLSEDAVFPSSKQSLINDQGWKVVDLTTEQRVHLSDLLSKIPERNYGSVNEVINALGVAHCANQTYTLAHLAGAIRNGKDPSTKKEKKENYELTHTFSR